MSRPQPRYRQNQPSAEQLLESIEKPLNDEAMLAQLTRLLTIVRTAEIGKAIIVQLVIESEVSESDKPILSAISASLEKIIVDSKLKNYDKVAYSMAALLAAYELGKMPKIVPKKSMN